MADVSLETLRELMHHMEWADAGVWRALQAHAPAAEDARVRDLLVHLHGVQRAFLALWTGQPVHPPRSDREAWDIVATQSAVRAYYRDLDAAMASFNDAALRGPMAMPGLEQYEERIGRPFDKPTVAETILQVAGHSTYHRGQVNARLRDLGGEPPLVDYIAWIWFGRPAPDWT